LIAFVYALLGAGLYPARGGARLAVAACLLGLTLLFCRAGTKGAEVWTFDAGQGNSSLLLLPGAGAFLVDAGALGNDSEAGNRLARALLSTQARSLRGVFLTHFHADHVRALEGLCDRIEVETIWIPPYGSDAPVARAVLQMAREKKIPVQTLHRGHSFWFPAAPDFHLDVLHPAPLETLPFSRSANDTSLVLRLACRGNGILFPGDLEEDGLARLFEEEADLSAEVLMAPHHGRTNLLWPALLHRVRPVYVIISGTGDGGAEETAAMLGHDRIPVLATWRAGAVKTTWASSSGWTPGYWRG
jgi:competence protein ComEC